ncbi:MAG: chromate resistance protein ChrB domain-containing protein [Pseudomonadota bacterium]
MDSIACQWLIRRFVNPGAKFLFVAPSEVLEVAEKFHARPFCVANASRFPGGKNCAFDIMIKEFELQTRPLQQIAKIVWAIKSGQPDLVAEAAGLMNLLNGLSQMYEEDLERLEAGTLIFDALYHHALDPGQKNHGQPIETGAESSRG